MQQTIFEYVEDTHYQYGKRFNESHFPIRLFEAFAGIGCQAKAFIKAGIPYVSVGISEIDKYALKSYEAIHGKVDNFGDISKMTEIPPCDIFTWSFPCIDLSKAGKRAGLDGTRSGLVYEVLRLLSVTKDKPKVLIMENVPDLVQEAFKSEFYEIQKEIESYGYQNHTMCLNAKHHGVAQNRDRVFMVSILGGGRYEFPPRMKLEKRLRDYLEEEVDEKYYLSDKIITSIKKWNSLQKPLENIITEESISPCLTARGAGEMHSGMIIIEDQRGKRTLTQKETWRLMGIDDEDFDKAKAAGVSDSQLYKQAGNGLVVDVFAEILKGLVEGGSA